MIGHVALGVAYLFVGRVFMFLTRKGISERAAGAMVVVLGWPLLVLFCFAMISYELVATWGEGYDE